MALISAAEAAARLGVKRETLYAYVSRGRIAARPDPDDPRRSLYSAEDVERIKRLKTEQIAAALGHCPYDEVIHRDNMAVTSNAESRKQKAE